jgi:hypothetical protein
MQNDPFDDFPKKAWRSLRALREIKKEMGFSVNPKAQMFISISFLLFLLADLWLIILKDVKKNETR